ncbi:MAG: DUF3106 domain-containing protein [Isosphaeraceae bacterium]
MPRLIGIPRPRLAVALAWINLAICASLAAQDSDTRRLQSLSRERRQSLAAKLQEFETLDPAERARVRALDQKLAELPETQRADYLAVLRRYHVWLSGLSEAERAEINDAPPTLRASVVSRIKTEQSSRVPSPPLFLLAADFGGFSPFDLANRMKVWLALDAAQKAEINRLEEPARSRRLQELGRSLGVSAVGRISQAQEDQAFDRARRSAIFPLLNRPEELVKVGRLKQRLAESAYFSENPPAKVSPENLLRFAEAMPIWMRSLIDPMPPDDARKRLTVLYRLVFPAPAELPSAAPARAKPSGPPGIPAPPKPTGPAAPF